MTQTNTCGTCEATKPVAEFYRWGGGKPRYRTYRGLQGERIRVPEASFATMPKLHAEPQPFPFSRMAAALGPLRDRFAQFVNRAGLFEEALQDRRVSVLRAASTT